ncbi:MAG: glycosyltransferase [Parcubacteria group bacterium Athens1014_10]|nr:MAG: glycosyltransferase [Parcubacteria group bacterium Athens1014_10]TSD04724.1 MAG: glycosyltransferase [Parcubacteria group bacterium Athens0714_12]
MQLSIIILNYKQKGLVKNCLKNIETFGLELNYEIIVVDNNSKDGCEEMIKKNFHRVKIIASKKNLGYAEGNNLGIKEVKGDYFLILNPDITVLAGSIEKMFQFMEDNKDCGICGPKLLNPDQSIQISCCRFPKWHTPILRRTFLGRFKFAQKELSRYLMADYSRKEIKEVDWLLGASLLIRKSAAEKVGLMDERYFLYFEDIDWCRRFRQAGYKVYYLPPAEMIHFHQRLSAQKSGLKALFDKPTWIHIISAFKYFWKWRRKNF